MRHGRTNIYYRVLRERAVAALDKQAALEIMRVYTSAAFRLLKKPIAEHGAEEMREEQLRQQHDAAQRIEDESYE